MNYKDFIHKMMPSQLNQDECGGEIPMPQFDKDGLFKSHFKPFNRFQSIQKSSATSRESSTIKDFERLKILNTTQFKDPVLEKFLERAKEMETHAGPSISPTAA